MTKMFQVDAFTNRPFSGNPAAVCLLDHAAEERWMQGVANEMNLAETAFLYESAGAYNLRWFTPTTEVELCGHATLASAHILWETGLLKNGSEAAFDTLSGRLTAFRRDNLIWLNFPATEESESEIPSELTRALGANPLYGGRSRFDYLLELKSEEDVRALKPDFKLLSQVKVRGVIVTAKSDSSDYDFVSRFFAPASGIDEDPVTGSAHCCLGPYWKKRLGKETFMAVQASPRSGLLNVEVRGERVMLGGQAVTVLKGELQV
jgi:PhzF family phenazine biosynthesis protein